MKISDRLKIDELHHRDMTASMARDFETLVSLMDEDMILIPSRGEPLRGKKAVAESLKAYLELTADRRVTEYVHEFEEVEIAGDWAFEWGRYRGTTVRPDGPSLRETGKIFRILKKQADGSWKVFRAMGVEENKS
jgi:uncharacterized protein (TIGR02246 family)